MILCSIDSIESSSAFSTSLVSKNFSLKKQNSLIGKVVLPSKGITVAETGLLLLQLTVTELEVTLVNLTLLGVILKYSKINSPITKKEG